MGPDVACAGLSVRMLAMGRHWAVNRVGGSLNWQGRSPGWRWQRPQQASAEGGARGSDAAGRERSGRTVVAGKVEAAQCPSKEVHKRQLRGDILAGLLLQTQQEAATCGV